MNTHLKKGADPENFDLECSSCNSDSIYQVKSRIAGVNNDQMSMQFLCKDCTKTSVLTINQLMGKTVIQYWTMLDLPNLSDSHDDWPMKLV